MPKSNAPPAPTPQPGHFGTFPPSFGLYLRASSPDNKNHYFYLGTPPSSTIPPLNTNSDPNSHPPTSHSPPPNSISAFTVHKGLKRTLQAQLHSTPSWDSRPLTLFGIEGIWKGTSILTLPALSPTSPTPSIVKIKDKGGIKEERYQFTIPVSTGGEEQTFEWRLPDAIKATPGVPKVRKLAPIAGEGAGEVLATWTEELDMMGRMVLGYFEFTEKGVAGQARLGAYWTLVSVASAVRLAQIKWEASAAADQMIKGAAKVALSAASMGAGMGG